MSKELFESIYEKPGAVWTRGFPPKEAEERYKNRGSRTDLFDFRGGRACWKGGGCHVFINIKDQIYSYLRVVINAKGLYMGNYYLSPISRCSLCFNKNLQKVFHCINFSQANRSNRYLCC